VSIPSLSRSYVLSSGSPSHEEARLSSPLHTVARVLLIATLLGAPWAFGSVQPWAWGTLVVLSCLIVVLWAAGCAHQGVLRIGWSPLYWPFIGLLILAAVQYFGGLTVDAVATREALLKLFTNFALFFLAGQLFSPRPENGSALEWLGLAVTVLAFALCIAGLWQMFWGQEHVVLGSYAAHGTPFGPYVNHNDYAGIMEMLLPISAAYLLSRSWNPLLLLLFWCGLGLGIISVWMSGSRGATIVLLIEGLLWAGILLWSRPRGVSAGVFVVLFGVVLVSAVTFSWLVSTGRVGGRAWSVFEGNRSLEVTLGDRLKVSLDTLRMARSHPWSGVGVGGFESVFPNYMSFPMDWHWPHAHDDLVEAVAETGLPGAVMMAVAFFLFVGVAFRHIQSRLRRSWGWLQMGATVGAVGLLCHSLVDFNLRIPANAAWFVVCLAVATHLRSTQDSRRTKVRDFSADPSRELLT